MSQYETATDRLVSIIQSIQLGRASGMLTARRGEGATQEEGLIIFINGQVTEASVGRRTGSGALNWLSTWGRCRFSFVPSDTSPVTTPFLPSPPGAIGDQNGNTGSYPRIQAPTSDKQSGPLGRQSDSLTPSGPLASAAGQSNSSAPIAIIPSTTVPLGEALRWIEQSRLSRIHKHLFLLIDGHRSVTELVRLTGKNQDEVHELLRDLVHAGVIRIGEQ
jgi:Domain of unknown function (DUF4388)